VGKNRKRGIPVPERVGKEFQRKSEDANIPRVKNALFCLEWFQAGGASPDAAMW